MGFFIINDEIVKKEEADLTGLFLGDFRTISQKMWFGFGGIPLFNENLESLHRQAAALRLELPRIFSNKRELFRITKRMLNKNKFFRSGLVHFRMLWHDNKTTTLITATACENFDFPFSEKGLLLTFANLRKNSSNPWNAFSFFNESLWEAARAELKGTHFQNAIVLNENNAVCECAGANIFMVKNSELITPATTAGCYEDVIKPFIFEAARKESLGITETPSVKQDDLAEMDELFLASEQKGIQWVLGIENKRYLHSFSRRINDRVNRILETKTKNQ